jgi:plastocyanin
MARALAFALMVPLLAPVGAGADELKVEIGHNRIGPAEITIEKGDTVRFHNQDEMPGGHTIIADDGSFSSPPLAKGASWSYTFPDGGVYPYHIKEHPSAKGKVTVE